MVHTNVGVGYDRIVTWLSHNSLTWLRPPLQERNGALFEVSEVFSPLHLNLNNYVHLMYVSVDW